MTHQFFRPGVFAVAAIAAILSACAAGPQVTRTQELSESADTPYSKILVVTLYSKFDNRRRLEDEIVKQLAAHGTEAVASTSLMNTRTPVTRATFMAMVDDIGADAVLLTQLGALQTTGTVVDMNPQSTTNLRPTYYYNVFSVEVTEYVEPQAVNFEHALMLITDLYSVSTRETVWGIRTSSNVKTDFDQIRNISAIENEDRKSVV